MTSVKKSAPLKRVKTWFQDVERRQQQRVIIPDMVDDTHRQCCNCGHEYTGRVCPQCGQVGTWARYTWRQAFLNFLDIWGLGNRPMFRTLRELFVRPGYMVRDYLQGHRQFYFPPFKLLAVSVVLMLFVSWLTGIPVKSKFEDLCDVSSRYESHFKPPLSMLVHAVTVLVNFLSSNMLYEWLFVGVIALICVWIAFKGVSRFNLVETYIFLIFVLSQSILLDIPETIGKGVDAFINAYLLPTGAEATTTTAVAMRSIYDMLVSVLGVVYSWLVMLLMLMDFKQFYGLSWKSAFGHLLLSFIVGLGIFIGLMFLAVALYMGYGEHVIYGILWFALLVVSLWLVARVSKKYRSQVNKAVIRICKASVLSVFMAPFWGWYLFDDGVHPVLSFLVVTMLSAAFVAVSLSPIYLYKKFGNTWITAIPLVLPIVAISCAFWLIITALSH